MKKNVPDWLCKEIDSIWKREQQNKNSMKKIETWLKKNQLITNEEDGFICSFSDPSSVIERADIEMGNWKGQSFKHFIETGSFGSDR